MVSCNDCVHSVTIREKNGYSYGPDGNRKVKSNSYSACELLKSFIDHEGVQHFEANYICMKNKVALKNCPLNALLDQ